MPDNPELERSRQKALDIITDAFAGGAMPIEEYEKRAGRIQNAVRMEEIRLCVADLPIDPLPGRAPSGKTPASRPASADPAFRTQPDFLVEARGKGNDTVACVMGERHMAGDWLNTDTVSSFTLMGSTTLDLRNTAIPPGRLKIDAFTLMGEITVIVPRGLPVKLSAFPFMGEARIAPNVEQRISRSESWVEVSGFALMGSIRVRSAD
jgi:hypothetical protein